MSSTDQQTLDKLTRTNADRRILLKGGSVVSMDPSIGDLAVGDVLISGDKIEAVGPDLGSGDDNTIVVDATGKIVIPGFVDTHRHSWQGQFRRMASGMPLDQYIDMFHYRLAPQYQPDDIYAGTYLAALGALDSGITTMLDFAHNIRTAPHADAGIKALHEAGVRGVFTVIGPVAGEWDHHLPQDLGRLKSQYFATDDQLLTMRLGTYGLVELGGMEQALSAENVKLAEELDIHISADATFGAGVAAYIEQLGREGVLSDRVSLIHATDTTDDGWRMLADNGVTISLCPTSDPQVGCMGAVTPVQKVLDFGVTAGVSVDVECCLSSDIFAQMQATYTIQRMHAFNRQYLQEAGAPEAMDTRTVLKMATIDGAKVTALDHKVGSLTPGKQADVTLIDANDLQTMPHNNSVSTAVLGAGVRSVTEVFVAGEVKKWNGTLVGVDLDRVRDLVYSSRDRLMSAAGYDMDVTL